MMVLVAMGIGLVLGLIIERGLLRLVCDRDEVIVVLVTFSASLILEDMILLIWGTQSYPLYQPLAAAGNFEVGSLVLSGYDMGLIALAVALAIAAHWALKYTRYGRLLTVVIFDRETAAAFGVNVTVASRLPLSLTACPASARPRSRSARISSCGSLLPGRLSLPAQPYSAKLSLSTHTMSPGAATAVPASASMKAAVPKSRWFVRAMVVSAVLIAMPPR